MYSQPFWLQQFWLTCTLWQTFTAHSSGAVQWLAVGRQSARLLAFFSSDRTDVGTLPLMKLVLRKTFYDVDDAEVETLGLRRCKSAPGLRCSRGL